MTANGMSRTVNGTSGTVNGMSGTANGMSGEPPQTLPVVIPKFLQTGPARLKRRADFVAASQGARLHSAHFVLQAAPRFLLASQALTGARVGLTVTKKTGGAVERNRIRRRLREALRKQSNLGCRPDHDYVIVARRGMLGVDFLRLREQLSQAFHKIHAAKPGRRTGKAFDSTTG